MTNIYVNAELSAELEGLGVDPMVYRGLEVKQNGQYLKMPISIFCLLYPENAERLFSEKWSEVISGGACNATEWILWLWQTDGDWQAFVAEAVERRKAEKG